MEQVRSDKHAGKLDVLAGVEDMFLDSHTTIPELFINHLGPSTKALETNRPSDQKTDSQTNNPFDRHAEPHKNFLVVPWILKVFYPFQIRIFVKR